jgi:hypothetical protein
VTCGRTRGACGGCSTANIAAASRANVPAGHAPCAAPGGMRPCLAPRRGKKTCQTCTICRDDNRDDKKTRGPTKGHLAEQRADRFVSHKSRQPTWTKSCQTCRDFATKSRNNPSRVPGSITKRYRDLCDRLDEVGVCGCGCGRPFRNRAPGARSPRAPPAPGCPQIPLTGGVGT